MEHDKNNKILVIDDICNAIQPYFLTNWAIFDNNEVEKDISKIKDFY
jgi:hypothetical protein